MKRLFLVAVAALLVASPVFAQEKAAKSPAEKKMSATGAVTAVSDSSLTVKGKEGEWTFAIDKTTHVSVKGASKTTAAAKDSKAPLAITQYVKVGDTVLVAYHDAGGTKHAADVQVRSSSPAPAKK
jgi:hypothetical protein